jgi:hypothetical protein
MTDFATVDSHPTHDSLNNMKSFTVIGIALASATALGQSTTTRPYTPAVPAPSTYNAYGGYGYTDTGASTLEEGAMRGMASVISAKGDYNLATSAAAVNLTQAQKQDIENRQDATQAYFAMQETNRAARAVKQSQRLSHEQLVRIASQAAPAKVTSSEVDPVSGQVHWPDLLKREQFSAERIALEKLAVKHAQYGALPVTDLEAAGQLIEAMSAKLREVVTSAPAQQYVNSKNFLKSLMYAVNKTQLS